MGAPRRVGPRHRGRADRPGIAFVSLSCDDQNSTWDLATPTATINLEEDETVRSVFVETCSASSTPAT